MYKVGDRVLIVPQWPVGAGQNPDGLMDHWLGQVMTIREVETSGVRPYYRMKEDNRDWHWYEHMIDGLADEFEIKISQDDLMNFLT